MRFCYRLTIPIFCIWSVSCLAQNPTVPGARDEATPKNSVPQYLPCPDQPRTFKELSDSFAGGRLPSPSEVTGSWVLIGLWLHENSRPDLNCNGLSRGKTFEWVIHANGYSIEFDGIGVGSQTTALKPDRTTGTLTFGVSFGGENSPVFRCRLTRRGTLVCFGSTYYSASEYKKISSGTAESR